MGRPDKLLSPISLVENGWPANTPDINRKRGAGIAAINHDPPGFAQTVQTAADHNPVSLGIGLDADPQGSETLPPTVRNRPPITDEQFATCPGPTTTKKPPDG
jgi:hypothetical protein